MNVKIPPGFTTYETTKGQLYRLFGVVRPKASVADSDASAALAKLGLVPLTYYPESSTLPSDWPPEMPFKVSGDEKLFRAEGTWTKDTAMPTATDATGGSVIVYELWAVAPDSRASLPPVIGAQVGPSHALLYIGLGSLAVAGILAGAYFLRTRENPRETRKNYRGFTIAISTSGGVTITKNGRLAAHSFYGTFDEAKRVIDRMYPSRTLENPRERRLTVNDIEQWIDNDEGLYNWWKESRLSKRKFIQAHRAELEASIRNVLEGRKPAHYRAYGGYHENPSDHTYEVTVSNIGKVYDGSDVDEAKKIFEHYIGLSQNRRGGGRAYGENVVLWMDGEIQREYDGGSVTRLSEGNVTENPYRYDSTVKYKDVVIHVHQSDNGYCADYRAVAGFVGDPGDVVCASDRIDAINEAKHRIDTLFMQAMPMASSYF